MYLTSLFAGVSKIEGGGGRAAGISKKNPTGFVAGLGSAAEQHSLGDRLQNCFIVLTYNPSNV